MAVRFSASLDPKSRRRNGSIIALSALAAAAAMVATPGLATASPPSRTATESSSATLAPQFRKAIAQHSNKCLDVSGASTSDGASVIQWQCHGGANQDWLLVPSGSGFFFVLARHSGQCLDVRGASQANGAAVIQWPCHGGANQQWRRLNAGPNIVLLVARHSNKCLFVSGASMSDGAAVVQRGCLFTAIAQRWRIS